MSQIQLRAPRDAIDFAQGALPVLAWTFTAVALLVSLLVDLAAAPVAGLALVFAVALAHLVNEHAAVMKRITSLERAAERAFGYQGII